MQYNLKKRIEYSNKVSLINLIKCIKNHDKPIIFILTEFNEKLIKRYYYNDNGDFMLAQKLLTIADISLINSLGFKEYVIVPLSIVKDLSRFINFIIKDKKEFLIVTNSDIISKIRSKLAENKDKNFYLIVNENLKDVIILFYKK